VTIRLIVIAAILGVLAGDACATQRAHEVPLPRPRPTIKSEAIVKIAAHTPAHQSAPASGVLGYGGADHPEDPAGRAPATAPSRHAGRAETQRSAPPLAMAATSTTSPLDVTAVKQAIDLAHKGRHGEATTVENTISDPLARKLVEWVILHSEDGDINFSRYAAFIAENPSWPGLKGLHRHAEAALWEQQTEPGTVLAFFGHKTPLSAKGRFALARALLATGDRAGAQAAVREAWRNDEFSADVEAQARAAFADLITAADDKARMDARLDADDDDAGLRAAHHLDGVDFAIAKARSAVINKSAKAKALLEAVPAAGRRDPGYMFSRIQWLRREDKIAEAAQLMIAASREPEKRGDPDQWWVERRLIARKLIDLGDFRAAYEVARSAAVPTTENHRAEQQFTAGWIALRFLREPGLALAHFARVADGVVNPITLARSYYWQGRAARALGREQDAHADFEAAARYPTAYYGQLARAELGLEDIALHSLQAPPASSGPLEIGRAFEILYAVDQPDLVATMAADVADKSTDAAGLVTLAEITARHNDARATLLIGKIALGRGLPLARYAFPDFGVPNYRQIGPAVDRCVVFSIVRQESAFNPHDRSSANALGLMQVTPAAGRDTARRFKVPFDERRLMNDVAYNAELGTAELGNDLASWRGSYILAFVAYNAGPRRAEEWIQQYGDPRDRRVDPVDWIERIPIAETRNYVERVLENMQVYRARLDNNSKLLIATDLRRGG
jgi:soluble lytic murein transglycosylase